MTFFKLSTVCIILILFSQPLLSGTRSDESAASLEQRLEWFQDQKFGFMVHWGTNCQWGVEASWGLCLDYPQIRTENWNADITVFRKAYWEMYKSFYPMQFGPEEWARIAKEAGMKYFVFTTKHHDGFSMYDTKLTDYRITSPDCPYHAHPNPDITARLFNAFRSEGFGIGAYYSKADWHSPFYWKPNTPAPNRNVNYDTALEPERWQKFVDFVHGQIGELMSNYGRIDILWLDAGWVRPKNKQDLQMDRMVDMARSKQPGLIVVDRTVSGPHENYLTPEEKVPDKPLGKPWESCFTISTQWSFKPYDDWKSTRQLIHLLVDIVAKGGNLILNVGPMPNGQLPPPAIERMKEIGAWLKINGEAIYSTRAVPPYKENNVCLTKRNDVVYALYLAEENKEKISSDIVPQQITLTGVRAVPGSIISMLGIQESLPWEQNESGLKITVPVSVIQSPPCRYAYVFKIKVAQ